MISQEALEWEISKQEYDKKVQRLQRQLDDANTTRAACDKVYVLPSTLPRCSPLAHDYYCMHSIAFGEGKLGGGGGL